MKITKLSEQPIICQLLSFIPKELVQKSVSKFASDKYYKTMSTYKQFVVMLYGIISKSGSLNSLCKCLLFIESKLCYLEKDNLPAISTLSSANCSKNSEVFADLYYNLLDYYKEELQGQALVLPINGEASAEKFKRLTVQLLPCSARYLRGLAVNLWRVKKGRNKRPDLAAF